jgi:hypothetical protein
MAYIAFGVIGSIIIWVMTGWEDFSFLRAIPNTSRSARVVLPFDAAVFQFLIFLLAIWSWLQPATLSEVGAFIWLSVLFFPLAAPLVIGSILHGFGEFIDIPILSGGITFAVSAFALSKYLRGWAQWVWPTLSLIAATSTFLLIADMRFDSLLEVAAQRLSPDCLDTGSIRHALAIQGAEYQFNLYAAARKGAGLYAWSFRTRDFYKVPESAMRNVRAPRGPIASFPSCYADKKVPNP